MALFNQPAARIGDICNTGSCLRRNARDHFRAHDTGVYHASKPLTFGDHASSAVLQGMRIDLDEVFPDLLEEPEEGYGVDVKKDVAKRYF